MAGAGNANPMGVIPNVAMMLKLTLGRADLSVSIEKAIAAVVAMGNVTPDLVGVASTRDVARQVITHVKAHLA